MVARFDGHIAQYLGDGLLVYFGYPLAHEDDAQRAVRAGLGIVEALGQLNTRLTQERGVQIAVRLGIHTGLVVVGEVGGSTRQEQLALGETPNLAARLQGVAAPNTLVISATTFQLLGGFFACQPLGTPLLKGQAQPLMVYRVLYESMARSRLEAASSAGWTPLVGREQESGLLLERWAQVKEGGGQVVLLSGEAGIGKSRLVQVLQAQVAAEAQALADQLVALALRERDSGWLLEAHHAQWTTLSRVYEPGRCWHHAEQGIALYQPERHHRHVFTISDHDAGVCCRGFGALSLWQLGHLDQALTHSRDAVALARQLSHPTSLAHALTHATWLLQLRRDLDTGLERAAEIVAVAAEQGFAQYLATASILKGWLLTRRGQGDEGLALMRQGLGSGHAKGTGPSHAYFLYLLAEAHLQLGEARLGLERLAEALDEINRVGTRAFEPEMHRVHGELLWVVPDGNAAGEPRPVSTRR